MEKLSTRLRRAMDLRDMKQADLAEKTGINKGALSSYLSDRYKPKQDNIYLLAQALNVRETWLMGLDVPMERDAREGTVTNEDDKKLLDLLSRMTDEEKQELIDYMKYLISKRVQ